MSATPRRVRIDDLDRDPPDPIVGAEARRLARVLRLRAGDALLLFDGRGSRRAGELVAIDPAHANFRWTGPKIAGFRSGRIEVAAAIPKGRRMETMVEKLCELGVMRLTPLLTERGVVRPDTGGLRTERWASVAREAARQCRRDDALDIDPPAPLAPWLDGLAPATRVFHAHPDARAVGSRGFVDRLSTAGDAPIALAVGPEGGWTMAELKTLSGAGSVAVSLGSRILRVETAAIVLATLALAGVESP